MKISDVKGKMRVRLTDTARGFEGTFDRQGGTLTSGRILRQRPGYEEGLHVRVKWDGMPTPENWHLEDIQPE